MKNTYSRYILSLASLLSLTTVILSISGRAPLSLYFSLYLLETLLITLFFAYLDPRARKALERVGVILFALFAVMVIIQALEIIFGWTLLAF